MAKSKRIVWVKRVVSPYHIPCPKRKAVQFIKPKTKTTKGGRNA